MATKKPAPKPVPKAPALRGPDMAPINVVRNPNFELEMAQQNYANLMADQQARLAAQGRDFTQGRLMGAPSGQGGLGSMTADQAGIPADQRRILDNLMAGRTPIGQGGIGGLPANQAGISPEQTRILNDLMARQASRGGLGGMTADQAGISAEQRRILDNLAASQNLGGGIATMTANQAGISPEQKRILDDLMARDQVNFAANEAKRQDFMKTQKPVGGSIAGPIYGSLAGNVLPSGALANQTPDQLNAMRMQQYNQFLSQGMQNSNTLNQGSIGNLANMQAKQPAIAATPKPAMPVGGIGMQKSKAIPLPRTFSTRNTPSARFG